jgi:hypothetical protein
MGATCCALGAPPSGADTAEDSASFAVQGGLLQLAVGAALAAGGPGPKGTRLRVPFTVLDARGTGAGWSVDASFLSSDAYASPVVVTVAHGATVPALPPSLGAVAQPIVDAAPGSGGMGRFAGALAIAVVPDGSRPVAGQLTLTLASAP